MSKFHVVEYFLEQESQYLEMINDVKEFKQLLADNKITQEDYLAVMHDIETIKANYERIAYIMMLLNKPNRKSKDEVKVAQSWYDALKTSSKEALFNENFDALCHIKELIKKGEIKDE